MNAKNLYHEAFEVLRHISAINNELANGANHVTADALVFRRDHLTLLLENLESAYPKILEAAKSSYEALPDLINKRGWKVWHHKASDTTHRYDKWNYLTGYSCNDRYWNHLWLKERRAAKKGYVDFCPPPSEMDDIPF